MSGERQAPHYTDRLHPRTFDVVGERDGSNRITADVKVSMGVVALLLLLRLHPGLMAGASTCTDQTALAARD
jgi:hypothetical protein